MEYVAYVDGSYKGVQGLGEYYAGVGIIAPVGTSDWKTLTTIDNNRNLISMRNVAGELMAAMLIFEYCSKELKLTKEDTLHVYYDYQGIEAWVKKPGETGYWRSKNFVTQSYAEYYHTTIEPAFNVVFHHVAGHTGEEGNTIVDLTARKLINDKFKQLMKESVEEFDV